MRALVVAPGPQFSTYDVFRGWVRGLEACGVDVMTFDLELYLNLFGTMKKADGDGGDMVDMFPGDEAKEMAAEFLQAELYRWWPDVVVIVQAIGVPKWVLELTRSRGHKVVIVHTESPYEDDRQVEMSAYADLNLLNDPTNIDRFERALYMPHAYDPQVHRPGPPVPGEESDVCFIGTGYPERVAWLEAVNWDGIDVALGGHWRNLPAESKLRKYLAHDIEACMANDDTVVAYRSSQMSFNIYRTSAEHEAHSHGWAVGPREIELAAIGTFFLREARAEGDELFPMLPTFTCPEELEALIREWLPRRDDRAAAALKARAAIADRSFPNHAKRLLQTLGA